MNTIWVFALAIGVASGDVGLGYHYKVPHTSYGVPAYPGSSSSGSSDIYNSGVTGSSSNSDYNAQYANILGTGSNYYTGQSSNQGGQSISSTGQSTDYHSGFQSTGSSVGSGANSNYYQTTGFSQPTYQTGGEYSAHKQYETSNQYQSSGVEKYQQYYNVIQQQPPQVFKHYYVHAAPEEPEIPKSPKPIVLPPAQKHYKIIFIKAPSVPAQAPQIVPVQQQNEEKTIVYVLVQKPEDAQNIVLPKVEQKPPSKPEVYFIKYNNKHDSQAVINNIVSDLNKGGNDSGYSGLAEGINMYTNTNEGSSSSGLVFGQGLSSSGDQGSSSTFDSSSTHGFGSGTSGSSSNVFGSDSSGSTTFGSGTSSNTFGSTSTGSNAFGSSSTGSENYGSSIGSFGSTGSHDASSNVFGSVSTVDTTNNGYDSSSGLTSISSTSGPLTGYESGIISTSQGVPHETYGVPKFKVV